MKHRIAYLKGSIDNPTLSEHDQKIMQPILQRLLDNDFASGLGLERLAGTDIYAIRVDLATRILFTKVNINKKSYLLPLELIENHDYQKSRFLQKGVLKKFLQNWMPTLIELNEIKAESFTPIDDHEQETLMHDLLEDEAYAGSPTPMLYYGDSVICLNADQEHTAVSVTLPAIVTGGPGAGKSCAALYALWHQWMNYKHEMDDQSSTILPFMYICESEILCHKMEEDWDNNFAPQSTDSNPKPRVIFSTYEELIKKYFSKDLPSIPHEKLADEATKIFATESDFRVWWTSIYQPEVSIKAKAMSKIKASFADASIMNISAEEIYEEFRICCGYRPDLDSNQQDLPFEYKMLGSNQSICSTEEQKMALWGAFKAYKHFLQTKNKTDLAFLVPNQVITPQIGFTVIDEIQDLSLNNIDIVIQLTVSRANKRQIFAAGDSHQNVSDAFSSLNLIEQIFRRYNHGIQPDHINLPGSYRCSKAIIDAANCWLGLQYYLCGGLTDKKQYVELVSAMDSVPGSTRVIDYADIHLTTELSNLAECAHVALIYFKECLESEDLQRDFNAFKIRLTPQGAKGCEYSTVIAVNPFSGLEKINKMVEGVSPIKPTNAHLPKNQEKHRSIKILIRRFNSILVTLTRGKNNLIIVQKDSHQYTNLFTWLNLPLASNATVATPIIENASSKTDWLLEARKLLRKGQEESAKRIYIDELGHTEEAFAEFKILSLPKITLKLEPTPAAVLPSPPTEATPCTPDVLSSTQTSARSVIESHASGNTPTTPNPMRLLFTSHKSNQRPTQPAPASIPTKAIKAPDLRLSASSSMQNQLSSKAKTNLKIDAQNRQKKWEIIPKLLGQTLFGLPCDQFLRSFFSDTMLNLPDNFLLSCFSEVAPSLIAQEMITTLSDWIINNQNALFTPENVAFLINQIEKIANPRIRLLFELVFHKFILISDGLTVALKQAQFQKWVILNIQKPPEPDQSHVLMSALISTKWDEFLVYIHKKTNLSIPNEVFTLKFSARNTQYASESIFTVLLLKLHEVYQVPLDQLTESQKESVKICMIFLNQIINEKKNQSFIQKQLNESAQLNRPSWLYSLATQITPTIACHLLGSLLKAKIIISPKLWFDTHPQHHPLMLTLTMIPDGISFLKQMLVVHPEYTEALFRKEDFFVPAFMNKKSSSSFQSMALVEHGESLLLRLLIFHPTTLLFTIDKKEHIKKLFRDTTLVPNTIVKPGMNFITALLTRGLQQHTINPLVFLIALIKKHPELIMTLQIDAWAISKQGELTYLWDELIKSDMEHAKMLLDLLIHTSNEKQALIPEAQLIGIAESIFQHSALLPETTIQYNCMLIRNMIECYPHINWPEIISKATHHSSVGQHYLESLLSSTNGKMIFPAMLRVELATLNPQQSIDTLLFGDDKQPSDKPCLFDIYWRQADMQESSFQILYEWWLNLHSNFPSNNVADAIIPHIEQTEDKSIKTFRRNLFYPLFTVKVKGDIKHPSYSIWLHQKLLDDRSPEGALLFKRTIEKPQQFIQLAKTIFDKRHATEIPLRYWFMKNEEGHYYLPLLLEILDKHSIEEEIKYIQQIYTLVIEQVTHLSPADPYIFMMLETLIEAKFIRSNKRIQIRPNCDVFISLLETAPHLFNDTYNFWLQKGQHDHAPLWYFIHDHSPETSAFLTKLYQHPQLQGLLTDPRYEMMQQLEELTSNHGFFPSPRSM